MRAIRVAVAVIFSVCLLAAPRCLHAWSHKEHIQFTRMAGQRLIADPTAPADMKSWLAASLPPRLDLDGEKEFFLKTRIGLQPAGKGYDEGLCKWSWMPDHHALNDPRDSKVEPFAAHERLMHFVDLEYFLAGKAKREYKHDLTSKPQIEDIPNDRNDPRYIQAGYLPLRMAQCYEEFVKAIRENRLQPTGPDDTDNAVYWAGYLAHYVADNTQPHHATVDYKSASYFKILRKAPNVHAAMEYLMCDDEKNDYPELRREYWPMFVRQLDLMQDSIATDDPFKSTLQVAMKSYDALPLIGRAAANAAKRGAPGEKTDVIDIEQFFRYRGTVDGRDTSVMEMKARQTAWAVKRIERIWKQAWLEAKLKPSTQGATSGPN